MELLKTVTAGWAVAFLAGVAGFFHVTGSRNADRRTAMAGAGSGRVVIARLASGLVLALLGVAGALLALFLFVGLTDLVRSEVNGSLVVVFVWLFNLFLGPAMGGTDRLITRFFPTHFPTLVMLDRRPIMPLSSRIWERASFGWSGRWVWPRFFSGGARARPESRAGAGTQASEGRRRLDEGYRAAG